MISASPSIWRLPLRRSGSVDLTSADTLPGAHVVVLEGLLTDAGGTERWQVLATEQVIVRDVLAPSVALLAPAPGSYVDTGFVLRASATDLHSTVATVQGLIDSAPVPLAATAIPGEYVAAIKVASEGPLQLSARASDSAGNSALSSPREVIVDLLPPAITIDGIAEGALVNQPVQLQIRIADVSPVQSSATLDGQSFSSGGTVTADGPHLLRVTATDALGRSSEALRSFSIDRTPPPVQIDLPANGAIIFSDRTRVVGTTEAFASVALTVGAFNVSLSADGSGIFSVDNVELAPGLNRIAARATDRAGNVGAEVAIQVERRGQPVVALQGNIGLAAAEWANGTPLASDFTLVNIGTADLVALPVRLEARRRDSQQLLQSAGFSFDVAAGATRTHSFEWPTNIWGLGLVDIHLIADLPEPRAPSTLDVHALLLVDREGPALQFLVPAANASAHVGDAVRVQANDRLSPIAITELRVDAGPWVAIPAVDVLNGHYATTLPTLSLGPHLLTARTQDAAGNVAVTSVLPITVVGDLPLVVHAPVDGSATSAVTIDFVGTTANGALVRVRRGAQEWTSLANALGAFTVADVPLNAGNNAFGVRAEDGLGNFSAPVAITVTANGIAEVVPVPIGSTIHWSLLATLMMIVALLHGQRRGGGWKGWRNARRRISVAGEGVMRRNLAKSQRNATMTPAAQPRFRCAAQQARTGRSMLWILLAALTLLPAHASDDPGVATRTNFEAAKLAMLSGEDPGAYIAELKSHRGSPQDAPKVHATSAPRSGSLGDHLAMLAASLNNTQSTARRDARPALMRRALGEALLLRAEFEENGARAKALSPVAFARWQAVDNVQGTKLRALESALRRALINAKSDTDAATDAELPALLQSIDAQVAPRMLGARALPVASPDYAPRALPAIAAAAPSFANASAAPGSALDLIAATDTEFSDAILEKARSLDYEPVRIHDFVRSAIRTEWYAGAQKGATETLRSGGGNDADQASLLIALLRASSMPRPLRQRCGRDESRPTRPDAWRHHGRGHRARTRCGWHCP